MSAGCGVALARSSVRKYFAARHRGDKEPRYTLPGFGRCARIESLWKIRDLGAIVAPNLRDATCVMRALRDARDRGVIYITK
jgi:hypothetical protein